MTRKECERRVYQLLDEIECVCAEYMPGIMVSMAVFTKDKSVSAFAIDKNDEKLLDVFRYSDGEVRFGAEEQNDAV